MGRKKGSTNKITKALKEAILEAAEGAHPKGTVGYLKQQAQDNPVAFLSLIGKVLPMTIQGPNGGAVRTVTQIEFIAPIISKQVDDEASD
jgi:hypothetical protein